MAKEQDPTVIPRQTDPTPGLVEPVSGGQSAGTARRAKGQRVLSAKEQEQRQMALGATVPSKQDAMCNCTKVLHYSVFFDGTGNNKDVDEPLRSWSNVARLYRAAQISALADKSKTQYPIYISGVGTTYSGTAAGWGKLATYADTSSIKSLAGVKAALIFTNKPTGSLHSTASNGVKLPCNKP